MQQTHARQDEIDSNLSFTVDIIPGLEGSIQRIPRSSKVADKSTSGQVSNILLNSHLLVGVVIGHALLRSSYVHLVVLELADGLLDARQHPGAGADSNELEGEGNDEEEVREGGVQEHDGEGGWRQLPGDGGGDGGDHCSLEIIVEEGLGTVRNAEDVISHTGLDDKGGE